MNNLTLAQDITDFVDVRLGVALDNSVHHRFLLVRQFFLALFSFINKQQSISNMWRDTIDSLIVLMGLVFLLFGGMLLGDSGSLRKV